MQLSVSLPAADPTFAGLLPGVASPTMAPISGIGGGAALPGVDAFAGVLADAATSPTTISASTAAVGPLVAPAVAPDETAPPLAISWPFAPNRPVSPAVAEIPGPVAGEPEIGLTTEIAIVSATVMPKTAVAPASPQSTPSSPPTSIARSEKRDEPTTEATAMALACVALPVAVVTPDAKEPEPITDEPLSAVKDATEEGSDAFDSTSIGEGSAVMPQLASVTRLAVPPRFQMPTVAGDAHLSGEPSSASSNDDASRATSTPAQTPDASAAPAATPVIAPTVIAEVPAIAFSNGVPPALRAGAPGPTSPRASSLPAPMREATTPSMPAATEPSPPMTATPPPVRAMVADQATLQATAPEVAQSAAKIAASPGFAARENPERENAAPRNFVTAVEKQLTSRRSDLGTDVAKTIEAMPYASNSPRLTHADLPTVSSLVSERPAETREVASPAASAPEATNTAHRAVEAVLTAAQRFSTGERHAVSLQFSVGGADLNVRVELRADEVRATFRTDSAELRDALSHEWNAAQADGGDRPFRLAPPVFTSNDTSSFSQFSGEQAAQQQQQRQSAARQANDLFAIGAARSRGASSANAVAAVVTSPVRAALGTALHLHTLA